jgi:hypothetical protein
VPTLNDGHPREPRPPIAIGIAIAIAAPSELQAQLLQVLKQSYEGGEASGISTNAIRKQFSSEVSKLQLNRILYALKVSERVAFTPGSPPLWRHKPPIGAFASGVAASGAAADDEPLVYVLIDGGNVHDCLANLIPYAERDAISVRFYADLAFNGFGINPPIKCKNVSIFHAKTPDKNSADVSIIWELSRYVLEMSVKEPTRSLQIYVATRDLQFQSLKALVEENTLHSLTFCTNWEGLRIHIE